MRVLLFGADGMAGSWLRRYLVARGDTVVCMTRSDLDIAAAYADETLLPRLTRAVRQGCDGVVNAAGLINTRHSDASDTDFLVVNSMFPRYLANVCESENVPLVHISTDCVFSGRCDTAPSRPKTAADVPTASTVYGLSKFLGEPANACVVRTSIIGDSSGNGRSLVEWLKTEARAGRTRVPGYTNHVWNGVTALELAKYIRRLLAQGSPPQGVHQFGSPQPVSKCELLQMISGAYGLGLDVEPTLAPKAVNRALACDVCSPMTIQEQVAQMAPQSDKFGISPIPHAVDVARQRLGGPVDGREALD